LICCISVSAKALASLVHSKLKALIGKAAARTYDEPLQAVGHVCNLFSDEGCYNFFTAAGYKTDSTRHALSACCRNVAETLWQTAKCWRC